MKSVFSYLLFACALLAALGVGAGIAALMPAPAHTVLPAGEPIAQPSQSAVPSPTIVPKPETVKATSVTVPKPETEQSTPETKQPTPGKDFPPQAVHIGDVVDDALAYAKQLIPFLRTHVLNGRVQEEKVGSLFGLLYRGARDTSHENDLEYFVDIVTRELEKAGVCDKYGNQPIQ